MVRGAANHRAAAVDRARRRGAKVGHRGRKKEKKRSTYDVEPAIYWILASRAAVTEWHVAKSTGPLLNEGKLPGFIFGKESSVPTVNSRIEDTAEGG